jgi:hypothetical protein
MTNSAHLPGWVTLTIIPGQNIFSCVPDLLERTKKHIQNNGQKNSNFADKLAVKQHR